ncbi:MAG TPA: c-type cytochrome [Candidatus Acidoferrales bacterium]
MKTNPPASLWIAILLAASIAVTTGASIQSTSKSNSKETAAGDLKRGKYLVEEVAKCTECHTPRDAQGQLDRSRWLQGAPIWITPVHPTNSWAENAPVLAGFPSFSDADAANILEKGVGPRGEVIRPPMHIYHLSHEDALAIVAYLRSVPSRSQ